jgi:ElaB/YqjD/DUF883 family membrane-anchored ribosome-binding protein
MSVRHPEQDKLDQILQLLMQASDEKKIDIKQYVGQLYENIKNAEDQATVKVKEAATTVDKHVHEKPWVYVAAAALGGLIIGLFCHRRS